MKYDIADGEILSKVSQFDLSRGSSRIPIFICESIAGDTDVKFIAIPRLLGPGDRKFWGQGETEELALQDCLSRIRGISDSEIFPLD